MHEEERRGATGMRRRAGGVTGRRRRMERGRGQREDQEAVRCTEKGVMVHHELAEGHRWMAEW